MCTLQNLLICGLTFVLTRLVGVQTVPMTSIYQAKNYLSQYGYLNESNSNSNLLDFGVFTKALKEFQRFGGLPITGKLNLETLKLMSLPRCGVKDKIVDAHGQKLSSYAIEGSAWVSKTVTIRVANYPNGSSIPPHKIHSVFQKAISLWCEHTNLTCTTINSGTPTILISFENLDHGCGFAFDGKGGILAHAFFPRYGGAIHVDESEYWTLNSEYGINLLQTGVHEIGHALGLLHSEDETAIMYPLYRGYMPNFKLADDDIKGIQYLYGTK